VWFVVETKILFIDRYHTSCPLSSSFSLSSRGKCWKTRALLWAIKIGFDFIFPSFPATLEYLLVCLSNKTESSLAEKFWRNSWSFLTSSGLSRSPLLDVPNYSLVATGGELLVVAEQLLVVVMAGLLVILPTGLLMVVMAGLLMVGYWWDFWLIFCQAYWQFHCLCYAELFYCMINEVAIFVFSVYGMTMFTNKAHNKTHCCALCDNVTITIKNRTEQLCYHDCRMKNIMITTITML